MIEQFTEEATIRMYELFTKDVSDDTYLFIENTSLLKEFLQNKKYEHLRDEFFQYDKFLKNNLTDGTLRMKVNTHWKNIFGYNEELFMDYFLFAWDKENIYYGNEEIMEE